MTENYQVSSRTAFITRFTITHTAVYFVSGLIFATLLDYEALFATPEYAFMRPFDHPMVILGPSFQILRGALLAVAFLPFRRVITESRRGWISLGVAIFILMHVGADAADPGKIEAFIYANFSPAVHLATWPESVFSTVAFAWIFHSWERNPGRKRFSIPLITVLVLTVMAAVLGLLSANATVGY